MKIARHPYTRASGEVIVDAAETDTIILQVKASYPRGRREGGHLHLEGGVGSFTFEGGFTVQASVAMTDREARRLIGELEKALAS